MVSYDLLENSHANVLLADLRATISEEKATTVGPTAGEDAPRLLLVEDNRELRHFMTNALQAEYQIRLAADGLEGLRAAKEFQPQLILSDVMMSGMDGLEMLARFRQEVASSETRVIMLTARVGADDAARALDVGADDYLRKPFSLEELRARLRTQLRLQTAERTLSERDTRLSAIGAMASSIVHDVRNSLSGLVAQTSLAMARPEDLRDVSKVRLSFERIESGAMSTAGMLQELLDFARGGTPQLKLQTVSLGRFVDDVYASVHSALEYSGITFDVDCNAPRAEVELDPERVARALTNLILNARDAVRDSNSDKPLIRFVAKVSDDVAFTVADNGPGIEDTSKLFVPFHSQKAGGTGLGLATARNVAVAHRGRIDVVTRGQLGGAEFCFRVPLKVGETARLRVG